MSFREHSWGSLQYWNFTNCLLISEHFFQICCIRYSIAEICKPIISYSSCHKDVCFVSMFVLSCLAGWCEWTKEYQFLPLLLSERHYNCFCKSQEESLCPRRKHNYFCRYSEYEQYTSTQELCKTDASKCLYFSWIQPEAVFFPLTMSINKDPTWTAFRKHLQLKIHRSQVWYPRW